MQKFILLKSKPHENERFAAKELAFFLKQITGQTFKITTRFKDITNKCFVVSLADTALAKKHLTASERLEIIDKIGTDGFIVRSIKGGFLILGGSHVGTAFGVYGFLEKAANLKIYSSDAYTFDKKDFESFDTLNFDSVPDIAVRSVGICPVYEGNKTYRYRMRLREMSEGWGVHNHSYFKILPPQKYAVTHPDWYCNDNKNLCLTNMGMRTQFIQNLWQIVTTTPHAQMYMLGQEDNTLFCDCQDCKDALKKYGNYKSALMLEFSCYVVDQINKLIKEHCPKRKVEFCTFAYLTTMIPPDIDLDITVPNNLGVMIAPLHTSGSYSYFDKRSLHTFTTRFDGENTLPTAQLFEGWSKFSKKLYVWSYGADFTDYLCPFPYWMPLEQNYREYKRLGVRYTFLNGAYNVYVPNFTELGIFLHSTLQIDTSLSASKLIDEFLNGFYGGAAKLLREYIDAVILNSQNIEKNYGRKLMYVRFDDYPDLRNDKFWDKNLLENWLTLFDNAVVAAQTSGHIDAQKHAQRVFYESLPVKYLLMTLYFDKLSHSLQSRCLNDIILISKELNIDSINEGSLKLSDFIYEWKEKIS